MKRVVVIGAGAAGLAALHSLSRFDDTIEYVAYETSDRVGGTWILNDEFKPTSMYNNLRTNIPKEVMAYPDFPFPSDIYKSYIGHKEVLDYLESFAQHYQLHQFIKFRHCVVKVDPAEVEGKTVWNVTVMDCENECLETRQFDAVLVCNGHHSVPLLPDIKGQETFPGEVVHSHYYRSPMKYEGQTVLVLGSGASGQDISADLSPHVDKIYLSHNKPIEFSFDDFGNITQVAGIDRIDGDNIILKDKSVVHADVILLATGYRFSFPFLSKKCHPVVEDEHVSMIYKYIVDINHPSLYYIGLNRMVVAFRQFTCQCDYAAACIAGHIELESKETMEREYRERRNFVVDKIGPLKHFHSMIEEQWSYHDELLKAAGLPTPPRGPEKMFVHSYVNRGKNIRNFKDAVYRLTDDQEDLVVVE